MGDDVDFGKKSTSSPILNFCAKLACIRKRHRAWANTKYIWLLDKGCLKKTQRDSCIVKTTNKKKNGQKKSYSGNKHLKATQCLVLLSVDQDDPKKPSMHVLQWMFFWCQVLSNCFWTPCSAVPSYLLAISSWQTSTCSSDFSAAAFPRS